MQDKISVLLIYGLLGLLLALSPSLVRGPLGGKGASALPLPVHRAGYWTPAIAAVFAVTLFIYTQAKISSLFVFTMVVLSIGFSFLHRESLRNVLHGFSATLLACAVGATLPWWRRQQPGIEVTTSELLLFAALLVASAGILLSVRPTKTTSRLESAISLGVYAAIVAYISYSLATMVDADAMITLWHHWGAYIDPSELVVAGARLLHDIPAQYGAGPTLLLRSVCGSDCWRAAYWVVGTATFAYALLIGAMAWLVASGGRYRNALLLLLCVVTCMFWNAFPPAVSSPNITPSTSGLRFLPVVMLAAWILFTASRDFAFRNTGGHLLWILGAVWSPEALFYVTAVWWPVYLFDCAMQPSDQTSGLTCLIRAGGRLVLLAVGTILVVCLAYYLLYGVLPVPRYFIAYMLYPPGPLPINPRGTIWYFAFSMALSVCVAWAGWRHTGNATRFRRSLTLQLLAFSTFSYYLGRSHDNNLLNLLPFVMLVLQDTLANAKGVFPRQAVAIALASLVAWLAVFGWGRWQEAYRADRLAEFGFSATRARLAYDDAETASGMLKSSGVISKEQIDQTSQLMDELSRRGEPFVVMDQYFLSQPRYPARPWSAIQSATNFEFFPSAMRREFLQSTANHLHRSGWLIIARSHSLDTWLDDFDSVYDRTGRIDLGTVYAIRFSPKH
ncbi:UNVERIFIED_ORG: hypothetical protein J2Y81_003003 [Paraburkholderia sediminicola]|nr:hypothetical protein [Paraburkholderia sediminicola]